jgi:ABC-type Fe3+/spermidine/putrescine transport system ATPase subunit
MLEVTGLCKRYLPGPNEPGAEPLPSGQAAPAPRWLAHHLNLTVAAGQTVALLGASGSGKSTLLAMLAGLEPPDAGCVRFNGEDITAWPPERRRFALLFQDFALFPHLSVQDNVAFALVEQRLPRAEARRQAVAMLAHMGLADRALSGVERLSGGEQQRVALARALVSAPRLLLLDEPFSALDADLRLRLRTEFAQRIAQAGMACVLVTHDEAEARAMGQHGHRLVNGQLQRLW